jgi:signal transduction histidine kinase
MQERLQRFVDDRTQMLAAISHDLRTVLTRLQLRVDFIEDEEQRGKALQDLTAMQTMLNATLEFARDDSAGESRTALDIAVLLQSLCDDWSDSGERIEYQGAQHLTFNGRPVALQRMFSNLIENALRYGHEANVILQADRNNIQITVADRGPGIAQDMREKVFAPFFRLEPSRSRETGGTGLGLAVARSIARRHGGDITLADHPEGGLLVHVQLPRTHSEQAVYNNG